MPSIGIRKSRARAWPPPDSGTIVQMDEMWSETPGVDKRWNIAAFVAAVLAFVLFSAYRVRFVGGCDSCSYLLESLRIRGVAPGLRLDPSCPVRAPLAPLCMVETDGAVVSFFPPGFPLLLAVGGAIGCQFLVSPFLGAASGLALFFALRPRVGAAVALGTMCAWLCSPVVFWGSTQIMSDLPAAAFGTFALLALTRGSPTWAGILLGYSLGIRPMQALVAPALLLIRPKAKTALRFGAGLALALVGWAIFIRISRGTLSQPYGANLSGLNGASWKWQLSFLLGQSLVLHLPLIPLALVGIVARPRASSPFALWFGAFLFTYALWAWPFNDWWWMRYMLPGLPGLFVIAAEGAVEVLGRLGPDRRRVGQLAGAMLVAGYAVWSLFVSPAKGHKTTGFDARYPLEVAALSRVVPAGALVGSLNLSGPLRLYSRFESFFWCHSETTALLDWAVRSRRPVYLALDDGELACNLEASEFVARRQANLSVVATLPSGRVLRRLAPTQ
jgi:hypothetical protein